MLVLCAHCFCPFPTGQTSLGNILLSALICGFVCLFLFPICPVSLTGHSGPARPAWFAFRPRGGDHARPPKQHTSFNASCERRRGGACGVCACAGALPSVPCVPPCRSFPLLRSASFTLAHLYLPPTSIPAIYIPPPTSIPAQLYPARLYPARLYPDTHLYLPPLCVLSPFLC